MLLVHYVYEANSNEYTEKVLVILFVLATEIFSLSLSLSLNEIYFLYVDPTPQISVANQTLYIAENSPPHQVLTEVYVKAATPHETEDALVHFTIKPGNIMKT